MSRDAMNTTCIIQPNFRAELGFFQSPEYPSDSPNGAVCIYGFPREIENLKKTGFFCVYCSHFFKPEQEELSLDHVISWTNLGFQDDRRGPGNDFRSFKVPACRKCNTDSKNNIDQNSDLKFLLRTGYLNVRLDDEEGKLRLGKVLKEYSIYLSKAFYWLWNPEPKNRGDVAPCTWKVTQWGHATELLPEVQNKIKSYCPIFLLLTPAAYAQVKRLPGPENNRKLDAQHAKEYIFWCKLIKTSSSKEVETCSDCDFLFIFGFRNSLGRPSNDPNTFFAKITL